jgi:O-antigen/teichoic acid export membrane protein
MLTKDAFFKTIGRLIGKMLGSRLVMDSFWSLFGNVLSKGLALAAGIVVARLLGKDIFGSYGIVKTTLLSLAVFSSFGLGYTTTKLLAETNDKRLQSAIVRVAYRISLCFGALLAFLLALSAEWLAVQILNAPNLILPMRVLSFLVVSNAVIATQVGIFSGLGKFKDLAKINAFMGFITFFSSFTLAFFYGFEGALAALALSQLVNLIFNFIKIKKLLSSVNSGIEHHLSKSLLKFSLPIALQEGVYLVSTWFVAYFVILFADFGEFGMYTAAMQWNAVVLFVPGILRNVILSHLSYQNRNLHKHNEILNITLKLNLVATLVPSLLVWLFSTFLSSLYGESFTGLGNLISLAVMTSVLISLSNVYTQAYMSKGLNWQMLGFRFFRDGGILILTYMLLKYQVEQFSGAYAPILSALIINALFLIFMIGFYKNHFKWS